MDDTYDSTADTLAHIGQVRTFIGRVVSRLNHRSEVHDASKLTSPEKEVFDRMTTKLASSTYGSDEYRSYLAEMKPALDHHYAANRHHPEHFGAIGIRGMTLLDVVEMLCDWKAATLRHNDGDIIKSIKINQRRFGYSDELMQILLNTVPELEAD